MFEPLTPLTGLTATEEWSIIFACAFMGLDFLVGLFGAFVRHDFQSAKVREGIGHKAMVLLVIVLAFLVQQASYVIGDFGFSIPLITPVCLLVVTMEIASVIETIGATYPELNNSGIFKFFNKKDEDVND